MIESSPRPLPALPAGLVIHHVPGLRPQWLAALQDEGEQVGPWPLGARGRTLQLVNASKPLRVACKRLNIRHLIAADISAEDTP